MQAFLAFPFYLASNAQAYLAFAQANPDLDAESVVWMVNAGVHHGPLNNVVTDYDEHPFLINQNHRLPANFEPPYLENVYGIHRATPETAAAFRRMRTSINRAGMDIAVVSAFRTAEQQRINFNNDPDSGRVAPPYMSEHQTGRAIGFWGTGTGWLAYDHASAVWMRDNAHRYGFVWRYPTNQQHITGIPAAPWQFTYVTVEIATHMHDNNIATLEEFVGRNPGARLFEFGR